MARRPAAAAAAALLVLAAAAPPTARAAGQPRVQAKAAVVVDATTGEALFARRASERRSIASATKLMTALLALERVPPDRLLPSPPYSPLPAESKIGLRAGERMTARDLLSALLLESANDAAVSLAENIGGSRASFVRSMNGRARELGLRGTRYANPVGLDDPGNYSTASDLAALTARLMRDRRFAGIVDRPRDVLRSGARRRVVRNRNRLVESHRFVDGVKTGHTLSAGYVLVGAASRDGARVISVALGEPSEAARDEDTLDLLRFGLAQFRRVAAVRARRPVAHAAIEDREPQRVALVAGRTIALTVRRGERPRTRVDAPGELEGPLPAGRSVGSVEVLYRGRVVRSAPLVTARAVAGPRPEERLEAALAVALTAAAGFAMLVAGVLVFRRMRTARASGEGAATGDS